jgi:hypothetical protein
MKRTKHRYAQMRNGQRGGSGSLFEARFKSKPITSVAQLMATTLYNDANARRAGLIHSGTAHEWSTGPLHAARPGCSESGILREQKSGRRTRCQNNWQSSGSGR